MAETPTSKPSFPQMSASAAGPGGAVPVAVVPKAGSGPTPAVIESVNVTIDGKLHLFPKGTNLLEACNQVGANVPFFCYHAGLSSPAVCRQCLVDVKGQPKPVPSCYTPVTDKMEVFAATDQPHDGAQPDADLKCAFTEIFHDVYPPEATRPTRRVPLALRPPIARRL